MSLPKGVTQRQAHYWVTKGYIFDQDDLSYSPGTGHVRAWSATDRRKLIAISKLKKMGFEVAKAAELARLLTAEVELDAGLATIPIHLDAWLQIDRESFFAEE